MKSIAVKVLAFAIAFSLASSLSLAKDREWMKKFAKMNLVEKEVNEKKFELNKYLKQADSTKDREEKKMLFKKAVVVHRKYKAKVAEYNKLRLDLKYKHPDQGDESLRKYLPLKQQTIQEIQKESGLNSQLTAMQKDIKEKYYKYIADEEESRRVDYSKPTGEKYESQQLTLEK